MLSSPNSALTPPTTCLAVDARHHHVRQIRYRVAGVDPHCIRTPARSCHSRSTAPCRAVAQQRRPDSRARKFALPSRRGCSLDILSAACHLIPQRKRLIAENTRMTGKVSSSRAWKSSEGFVRRKTRGGKEAVSLIRITGTPLPAVASHR